MKLLPEQELIWSTVVANSTMNRERNASGINSYEQEIQFIPAQFLKNCIEQNGQVKWLDLCCGQGKALIQSASFLANQQLQDRAQLHGVDLIDAFAPVPDDVHCLEFNIASLVNWKPNVKYDLITCIHGLHYIGDKLQVMQTALASLSKDGLFVANLDLNNIVIEDREAKAYLRRLFKQHDIAYNGRTRLLQCRGKRELVFDLIYKGASDEAGPNYTGQPAVNSLYAIA